MKFLGIFALSALILCAQAYQLPYIFAGSSQSSEEEYRVLLSPQGGQRPISLPGIGVIQQPFVHAVKVKVPRYASPEVKQLLLRQALASYGLNLQDFAPRDVIGGVQAQRQQQQRQQQQQQQPGLLNRLKRQLPVTTTSANKVVPEVDTVRALPDPI